MRILKILLVILLVLLAGYGEYYYMTKKATKDKEAAVKQAKEELQKEISDLKKQLEEQKTASTSKTSTSTTTCASTLTNADKVAIQSWKTYQNSKYNYSFKYPETWQLKQTENDFVSLEDEEAQINFAFRSAEMTAMDFLNYKVDSKKNIEVVCQKATKTTLSGDISVDPTMENARMILVQFKKGATDHLVTISYRYLGASISSDIVEAFDLILKTIEFK